MEQQGERSEDSDLHCTSWEEEVGMLVQNWPLVDDVQQTVLADGRIIAIWVVGRAPLQNAAVQGAFMLSPAFEVHVEGKRIHHSLRLKLLPITKGAARLHGRCEVVSVAGSWSSPDADVKIAMGRDERAQPFQRQQQQQWDLKAATDSRGRLTVVVEVAPAEN